MHEIRQFKRLKAKVEVMVKELFSGCHGELLGKLAILPSQQSESNCVGCPAGSVQKDDS